MIDSAFEKFKKKMNLTGGSIRKEKIFNSQQLLNNTFDDDAAFGEKIYFWELGKQSYDDVVPVGIRFYHRTSSSANGVTVKFQTLHDTPVIVGDIIYNAVDEEYWLCTEAFNIDTIHYQGKFTLCNWILKWQNSDGEILEYPCYNVNTTQYNSGETPNRNFTVGSSQHTVLLPCDDNTVILDTPQRFFLDKNMKKPTTYIVTQNDTTTLNTGRKGIVRLTLCEYEFNSAKDRIDLGVCDYHDKDSSREDIPVEPIESVILYNTKIIKSGGSPQVFTGVLFDATGVEIPSTQIKWDIVCEFKDQLHYVIDGNKLIISIDNDDYVDEEFKIICSDITETYNAELILLIDSLL